jgi:hypothetical protein
MITDHLNIKNASIISSQLGFELAIATTTVIGSPLVRSGRDRFLIHPSAHDRAQKKYAVTQLVDPPAL